MVIDCRDLIMVMLRVEHMRTNKGRANEGDVLYRPRRNLGVVVHVP
jgi:hypothetical protein